MLKAASATFTSLIANPNSSMMLKNLEYYAKVIENFNRTLLIDYEEKVGTNIFYSTLFLFSVLFPVKLQRFAQFYIAGINAYGRGNWQLVIENIERSLQQFIYDSDECRAFCEGEFDQGWHIDFTSSMASKQ